MRQRVENGKLHCRNAHLCDDTAVDELHKRVYDALRMHDYVNTVIRQIEEKVRLDHLERLVGECRAIDGDFSTHLPRRMSQCVFDRGFRQLFFAPAAEWSA